MAKITVIYIVGSGRSGSTILSSLLGANNKIINVGELYNFRRFFQTANEKNRFCECGAQLLDCEFWKSVRKILEKKVGDALVDLKSSDLKIHQENNLAILLAIKEVSGRSVILDSSKRIYRAERLQKIKEINVELIHLVRDVRAYAYSSKLTEMKKGASRLIYFKKVFQWVRNNSYLYFTNFFKKNYTFIKYEDFVCNADNIIAKIIQNIDFEENDSVDSKNDYAHQFSGNSRVFDQKEIVLKLDSRYQANVTFIEWWVATIISLPLLVLFRYPIFRSSH